MHYDALWCIMMHWVSNTERRVLIVCYRCYSKIQWRPRNPDRFVVDTSWYSILLNVFMFFFSRSRKGAGDAEHGFELRANAFLPWWSWCPETSPEAFERWRAGQALDQERHVSLQTSIQALLNHFESIGQTIGQTIGDGSKPWYLVNPKIAGKWMFIPLKMYL